MITLSYLEVILLVVDSILIGVVYCNRGAYIKSWFTKPAPVVHNHYYETPEEDEEGV